MNLRHKDQSAGILELENVHRFTINTDTCGFCISLWHLPGTFASPARWRTPRPNTRPFHYIRQTRNTRSACHIRPQTLDHRIPFPGHKSALFPASPLHSKVRHTHAGEQIHWTTTSNSLENVSLAVPALLPQSTSTRHERDPIRGRKSSNYHLRFRSRRRERIMHTLSSSQPIPLIRPPSSNDRFVQWVRESNQNIVIFKWAMI